MSSREIHKKLIIRRMYIMFVDVIVIVCSSIFGLLLRFDLDLNKIEPQYLDSMWSYLPINLIITVLIFYLFKLYHSVWRYASIIEMQNVLNATIIASITQIIGMDVFQYQIPRSYFVLYGGCLFFLTLANRFSYRVLRYLVRELRNKNQKKTVMIIGAGSAANVIIKESRINKRVENKFIKCAIDDDPKKQGTYIHGVKIIGTRKDIIECVNLYQIQEIIITMPSADKKAISEIVDICKETSCSLKILPGIYQFMNDEISLGKLRDVDIGDLLNRDTIEVNMDSIQSYTEDKVILVTGGGGSIGSELCRQLAQRNPKQLVILDIYENNVYDIQQELKVSYPELDLVVLIASVRDSARMNYIFNKYRPQTIYHAAAHKHVPLMEDNPNESIKNNVLGTWITVKAADAYGVEKFVLISTDKAVNPTNIMGASKRMCEMIVQTYNNRSNTEFVAVRFGNVLGSNGSVIPLFKKQIKAGGPITVTHHDIIRYFMTISEAVTLVLQAGAFAKGGEIFVLNMGEPVRILDLAENLIRLSGYKPYVDIDISFSGLRPGEKLYEELLMAEEGMKDTENKLIHIGCPIEIDEDKFIKNLEELKELCKQEPKEIRKFIKDIVPTYVENKDIC
ncbi:MAG: polysaccharide biosynthesis protein [Peptostreptococcaceae bacterium]|nr:polysaccharide biosynthesis protein [Peptostreptococcaceae bacterium]